VCLDLQRANAPASGDATLQEMRLRLDNCRRVLAHARAWNWSVVHVYRRRRGGSLSRPIDGLEPRPSEPVIARDGVSAFSSRSFRDLVDGAHEAQLVLIGYCLASTCLATAFAAHDLGLSTLIVEDAVSASPNIAAGAHDIETVARAIAARFTQQVSTRELIGRYPAPKLVVA
jgi:nicotinamidase-related amidase